MSSSRRWRRAINFNNVWAALGAPLDVDCRAPAAAASPRTFTPAAATARASSGRSARSVTSVRVGDEVIVHSGWWRADDPWVQSGRDPLLAESTRVWGYQTDVRQLLPVRPRPGTPMPAETAEPHLGGSRLLPAVRFYRVSNAHGLASKRDRSQATSSSSGGRPAASRRGASTSHGPGEGGPWPSSRTSRSAGICPEHGAVGVINREAFSHWGPLPDTRDTGA